jgi:hypothetical protein
MMKTRMRIHKNRRVPAAILLVLLAGSRIATAQAARLTVVAPPLLINPSWSNNQFTVSIAAAPGSVCTLEYTTSLTSAQWQTAVSNILVTAPPQVVTDNAATDPQRFYRVRLQ